MAKVKKLGFEQATREAARNSGFTYEEITRGADVGLSWFQKFMVDRYADYGVREIQKVADFLAANKKPKKPVQKKAA